MKQLTLLWATLCVATFNYAQNSTQTVKGMITDKVSEKPLVGASVYVNNSAKNSTITDANGKYYLTNITTGRITVTVTMLGYKSVSVPEVLVTAGKEVVLDLALDQDIKALNNVTVISRTKKGNATNEFAGTSSRSFSMEEVTRFAGGRNDPSKLVSNFAGVVSNSDSRNDIVVRGNSPAGVLWRLEGVPTPSPNHFATLGTTGGPISALNTNALKTSDFYTGAFPAEFGNANAAVFDIQLRSGNADKHETTLQVNLFSGFEAMLEGPLSKKHNGGSYLVGYRYSFVEIGAGIGINVGTKAIPKYQDWVYNIQLPKGKAGQLNFFGMGGQSNINFKGKDIDTTDFYAQQDQDSQNDNNLLVVGAKHSINVGKKSYLKSVLTYASTQSNYEAYQYAHPLDYKESWEIIDSKNKTATVRFSTFLNTKLSPKLSLRNGILIERGKVITTVLSRDGKPKDAPFEIQRNDDNTATLWQAYSQLRFKPTNDVTITGGLHAIQYDFNNSKALEPRAGISYAFNNNNTLQFNYGLHSQTQPLPVYLYQELQTDGSINRGNRNLDFTKAHHFVLGYERRLPKNWRVKAETYYQYLYHVPVEKAKTGFSMLNAGTDFVFPDKAGLVNEGTGSNKGLELTIEKFLTNGVYVLSSSSIFDSKYKGSDGIQRNTAFNYGYAFNLLMGKEWKMGAAKRNAFTFDTKLTTIGGRYVTPVDLAASKAANKEVLDETHYNSQQLNGYFRLDTKFGFRINSNKRKMSQTFYLDLQNVTNQKNIFLRRYNPKKQKIGEVYQIGFFPDILYRIQF